MRRTTVVAVLLAAASAADAAAPAKRGVAWGWMAFPSGAALRKVQEVPGPGATSTPAEAGLAYAVPAGSDPFEAKVVLAAREYLAAKYPSARSSGSRRGS